MARALINAPTTAKRGEVIEIRATIGHPMETGFRPGDVVFAADLFSAIAANPYLAFHTVATDSGTLSLTWEGDNGFAQTETVNLSVTG
jgi:sulfur-oxidizing protein SoxZ